MALPEGTGELKVETTEPFRGGLETCVHGEVLIKYKCGGHAPEEFC